jgi:glutathione synthase
MKNLAVVMDPIESIHPEKDSSLALMLEARHRGYRLYIISQQDLFVENGEVFAAMKEVTVKDDPVSYFAVQSEISAPLSHCEIILMRKDPPVDMEYIYTTLLLELAEKQGVRVINKPQSLRDVNEKLFISWFPQCCVPTLVTSSMEQLKKFLAVHKDIILKPLNGMGGSSIFRVRENDANTNVIMETLTQNNQIRAMAQRYISEVKQGDKRIIMVHGEPIPYTISRMAAQGETRSNLAAGGSAVKSDFTDRDQWICAQVGPVLKAKGLSLAGLDIIGEYLTEINVTSPTCLRHIDKAHGINTSAYFFDGL